VTTIALNQREIIAHLREHLFKEPFWQRRLERVVEGDAALHLAVFREPFLSLLLEGKKTIESRFSVNRVVPYGAVGADDLLLLKRTSGPVVGLALADSPGYYELDPRAWHEIRSKFAKAICANGDSFWSERAHARYATLIPIKTAVALAPFEIDKRDRRGWVVVEPAMEPERRWA
jgi:hypothetical protein